jgi:hypothetical protein
MHMPLPEEVVQSVSSTNFKSLGDGPSFYHNLAMSNAVNQQNLAAQNAIAQQQALGTVLTAAVGKIVKALTEADAEEAVSLSKIMSGDDVAAKIGSLIGSLGFGEIRAIGPSHATRYRVDIRTRTARNTTTRVCTYYRCRRRRTARGCVRDHTRTGLPARPGRRSPGQHPSAKSASNQARC